MHCKNEATKCSHLLRLFLLLIIVVFVVVCLFLLALLYLAKILPLLSECICLCLVICDNHVVEDGPAFDLPKIESDETESVVLVHCIIVLVFRIRYLSCLPCAFVGRVRDTLDVPIALVRWIVLHWGLPLTVLLVVPIIRLLCLTVYDALLLDPIVGFLVLRVVHHGTVRPIRGLLVIRIWDLLGL